MNQHIIFQYHHHLAPQAGETGDKAKVHSLLLTSICLISNNSWGGGIFLRNMSATWIRDGIVFEMFSESLYYQPKQYTIINGEIPSNYRIICIVWSPQVG